MMECCFSCKHLDDYIPWYDTEGDEQVDEIYCDKHCEGFDYHTNTCRDYEEGRGTKDDF